MEMSRLMAQFTAATTDTALPLTPIGKISLMTTYTTEKTADKGTKTTNHAWLQAKGRVQTFGWYLFVALYGYKEEASGSSLLGPRLTENAATYTSRLISEAILSEEVAVPLPWWVERLLLKSARVPLMSQEESV